MIGAAAALEAKARATVRAAAARVPRRWEVTTVF